MDGRRLRQPRLLRWFTCPDGSSIPVLTGVLDPT